VARFTAKSITSTLTNAESVLSFNRLFSRRRIISTGLPSSLHILVGVQNAGHGRRGRVGERGQFINLRKKNHAPLETNTSMHSHSLHYTTAPQREGCRAPVPRCAPDAGGPRSRRGSRWKGPRRRRRRGSRRTAPSSAAPRRHRWPRRR
jgi:hypothetical protein